MIKKYNYSNDKWSINIKAGAMFFTMSILLIGCLAGYGRMGYSREATRLFESYQLLPDHKYYYSGPEANPVAVIGIHRDYILDSSLWLEVDLNSQKLKSWVRTMKDKHHNYPESPDGYYILDPEGKKIGIYYTPWNPGPVKMLSNNHVSVYLPDDEDIRDNDRIKFRRFN